MCGSGGGNTGGLNRCVQKRNEEMRPCGHAGLQHQLMIMETKPVSAVPIVLIGEGVARGMGGREKKPIASSLAKIR